MFKPIPCFFPVLLLLVGFPFGPALAGSCDSVVIRRAVMDSTFYSLENPAQDLFQIAGRQFVLDAGAWGSGYALGPASASLDTGDQLNLDVENEKPFLLRLGTKPFGYHHVVLHFGCGLKKVVVAGQTLELGESESVEAALPTSFYGQGHAKLRREGCGVALEIIGAPDPEETDPHPVPVEIPVIPYGKNCGTGSDCANGGAVDDPGNASSAGGADVPDLRASWFPGTGNDGVSPGPVRWTAGGSAAEAVTLDSLSVPGAPENILPGTAYLPPKTHTTSGSRLQYRTLTGLFEATSDDDVLTLRFFPAPTSTTPTVDWDEDAQQTPDFIATNPAHATRTITYTRSGDDIAVAVDGLPTHLLGININGTTKTTSWHDLINGRKKTIIRRALAQPQVETLDYEDHGGLTLVSRVTRVFKPQAAADGHVLVSFRRHATATGTDAADEVETLDYDSSIDPTFVTRRVSNDGGWSAHRKGGATYDGPALPMMAGPAGASLTSWSLTARPWLDADPPAAANGETPAAEPNPQESVIDLTREWSNGATTSETFTTGIATARSLRAKDTTTVDSTTFNRATQTTWSSSGASTSTERLTYAEGDWKGRLFRSIAADGGTITYTYAEGPLGETTTTATEGTVASPEGIHGKTTRLVTTRDADGLPLVELTQIRSGGSYSTATTTEWEYDKDASGKVTGTTITRDGRIIETTSTLGQTTTRIGEDGVTTVDVTTTSGSLLTSTIQGHGGSPDRVTTWSRDGLTTTATRSAAGESALVSSSTVNLLGQTISSTDEAGTVTTYSRSIDGKARTTETTSTNGVTRTTTRHRDGKFHSSGGNAQIPRRATYEVESTGFLLTTESTGPLAGETGHSHRWTTILTDWAGKTIERRQPSPPAGIGSDAEPREDPITVNYAYDNAGRLTAVTDNTGAAPRLTFHDTPGLGDTTSGLDVDNDNQFTPGIDRYSINTSTYTEANGSWWRQTTTETPVTGTTSLTASSKSSLNVAAGETIIRTDAAGAVSTSTTVFTPASRSTVTTTETPDGTHTSTTINGLLTSTTIPSSNRASSLVHDGHGRLKLSTDHRGATTWYAYDNAGRLATVTDHTGRVTTTVYFPSNHANAGLPWKTIAPGGAETITTYDEAGRVTAIGGNAVYAREHGYDDYGDLTTLVTFPLPLGGEGQGEGSVTTWIRDPGTGLVMRKVYQDEKETQYAWDMAGRLHQRQWARGVVNTWTHSSATGDLTGLTHSDDTFDVTYSGHDVFGRPGSVTEIRGANSATTTLEYNHLSGALTETHPSDHPYLPNLKVEARADDPRGRPTGHLVKNDGTSIHGWTIGYDTEGRVGSLEGHNLTANLTYHPGTNRLATQTTTPTGGGNPILTRATNIDLLGRTYGVIHTAPDPDAGNNPRIVTALAHGHDIQGRRKSARREDGTTWQYEYNTRSEVTGAEKRQSNSDLVPGLDFGYNYDGLGNRLSASKGQPALVTTYTPDAMNRYSIIESPGADDILVRSATAVEVEVDEEPVAVTTSGDFRGARVTADNSTAPAFPEISITGDNNFSETGHRWIPQAEFSPTYDDDGNLTNDGRWIYTWDAMNRLTAMTPTADALTAGVPNQSLAFAYDHLGRRIAKKVTTTTGEGTTIKDWRYLYEGWNVVAQFTADTNNTLTPDATYLWSLDLSGTFHGAGGVGGLHSVNLFPLPLGEGQGEGAKLCLACYDANGNIIAWTDTTGRVLQSQDYDPFGNRVIRERLAITPEQSERLEYGFSTKPLDAETGLIYYIRRYYGPRHGQWLSQDPIEEAGGLNLYGFVGNNATSTIDFVGLDFDPGGGWQPRTLPLPPHLAPNIPVQTPAVPGQIPNGGGRPNGIARGAQAGALAAAIYSSDLDRADLGTDWSTPGAETLGNLKGKVVGGDARQAIATDLLKGKCECGASIFNNLPMYKDINGEKASGVFGRYNAEKPLVGSLAVQSPLPPGFAFAQDAGHRVDRGHLWAKRWGGVGSLSNLVTMDSKFNQQGAWKNGFEGGTVPRMIQNSPCKTICFAVIPIYRQEVIPGVAGHNDVSTRRETAKWFWVKIVDPAGAVYEEVFEQPDLRRHFTPGGLAWRPLN